MDDHEKAIAYYKAGAMNDRNGPPPFVPSRVRLDRRIHGDWPIGHSTTAAPGEYDCTSNRHGAVSIIAENGKPLGLRLDEFEPIAWRENTQTTKGHDDEKTANSTHSHTE